MRSVSFEGCSFRQNDLTVVVFQQNDLIVAVQQKVKYCKRQKVKYLCCKYFTKTKVLSLMGKATNLLHRQMLIQLKGEGKNLSEISDLLNVPYSTLRNLWHRYRHLGIEKLAAEYANCGRIAPDRSNLVYRASLWLKYLHPQWGSPLIHYHLSQRYGSEAMVSIRTLQRWYKAANLVKPREQKSVEKIGKAQGVHNIWQVDAKERLVLADGQVACYLTIVDEKSGACLEAPVFPLCPNQPSSP